MVQVQGGENAHGMNMRKIYSTMTPIIIQSDENDRRIVFVPSALAANQTKAPEDQLLISTTVLVPFQDAIDEIDPEAFKQAFKDKGKLKPLSELFFKQGIRTNLTRGVSVLWRALLSDVQVCQLDTWNAMEQGKGTGEILERNPRKRAKVTEGKQLWPLTKRDCLKTLPWSHTSIRKREEESKSTSCVNGQVKTYIKFCIMDGFNNTDGTLPALIARAARQCVTMYPFL